jgi:type II restriction enzyme
MADKRDFDNWISNFKESIADYSYYVNFDKVFRNVEGIKVELNILNSLVGSRNIEDDFYEIVRRYPEVLKCIPLLIAVREDEIKAMDMDGEFTFNFNKPNLPIEQYVVFMKKTGLFDMISNHIINNLVDYAMGVETGLDSNARKNRGGTLMEKFVEEYIKETGFPYYKEVYIGQIQKKWGIDLSSISNKGKSTKRFDFVVEAKNQIFAIEVNFYASSGSKLNETARSYKLIAEESRGIPNFKFVWITDGVGWKSARYNLQETFDSMEDIYCIHELENGILDKILN